MKAKIACMLTLLLGASLMGLRAETVSSLLPGETEQLAADTVNAAATTADVLMKPEPEDPMKGAMQGRFLEKGADWTSDSVGWVNHLTLGIYSGALAHGGHASRGHAFASRFDMGLPLGIMLNYQFKPYHGFRLMYQHNNFNHNYRREGNLIVNEYGLGYLFNFTNYFKGFNPNKRLHVSATTTAFASQVTRRVGTKDIVRLSARGEVGLLFDYRVVKGLSVFVEPYVGLTSDDYDHYFTPHKYEFLGGVRGGIATEGSLAWAFYLHCRDISQEKYKPTVWGHNFYFGASAGHQWTNAQRLPGTQDLWLDAHAFLGYRFGPIHSLRAMGTYVKNPEPLMRRNHVQAELDYMVNFTNMWSGYDPKRWLRVSAYIGAGGRFLARDGGSQMGGTDQLVPMATAGVDVNFYVTPQVSFFVEPHGGVAFMKNKVQRTLFGGVRAGVQVDLIDSHIYTPHFARTDEEIEVAKQWRSNPWSHVFAGGSAGIAGVHTQLGINHQTMPFNVFMGYRFTPVQSLRLMATYTKTNERILRRKHLTGELDYMLNFSNLFYGYKPKRWLNVSGYVGAGTRAVEETVGDGAYALRFSAGSDLMFRLYKGVSVFVEPYIGMSYALHHSRYVFDYGVNGGVGVTLDDSHMYGRLTQGKNARSPLWPRAVWRHLFVGGSVGALSFHTLYKPNGWSQPASIFFGYRFSPNHAIRLKGYYIRTEEDIVRKRHVGGEVDYMINLSNAFASYRPDRLVNVMAYWGLGARYIDNFRDLDGKFSPMATMGVDVAFRIKNGLSAFVEPNLGVAKGKNQGFFAMYYGANVGLALNFEDIQAYNAHWGEPAPDWVSKKWHGLFFGGGAGWMRTQRVREHNMLPVQAFAGYRFNPIHGARIKMSYNEVKGIQDRRHRMSAGIDYMFNLSNILAPYSPKRFLNFIGFVGVGTRYEQPHDLLVSDPKLRLMGNAGIDIACHLTRNVNLFVEPYAGAVRSRMQSDWVNYFMGLNAGIVVNLQDFDKPYLPGRALTNHTPFFELGQGWMFPLKTGAGMHGSGLSLDGRVGVWMDPILGVRGSLMAQNYGYSLYYNTRLDKRNDNAAGYANAIAIKGRMEGLFNPLNLISDWQKHADEKKFELNISAGVEMGGIGKKYAVGASEDRYILFGLTAALQAMYKFSYNTALFIEPRYEYTNAFSRARVNGFGDHPNDHILTVNAGVRFIRGMAEQRDDERRLNFQQNILFGTSFGGYKAIAAYKANGGGRVGYSAGFNLGFLITPIHGVKINFQPSWYRVGLYNQHYRLMDYRLSYLLNFSNLYQSKAYRKLDVYWQVGGVWGSVRANKWTAKRTSPGVMTGFLVAYNFNRHWALTTEPIGQMMLRNSYLPGYSVKPRMARLRMDLSIGTMFRF